ncbi:MAG: DUF6152 family protein [Steroidobacteraceae bacterium]
MKLHFRFLAALITVTSFLGMSGAALAHHSAASWDLSQRISITGTVKEVQFRNPHGRLELVVDENGKEQLWDIETSAINLLMRRGWTPNRIKVGDKVTLNGHPHKTLEHQLYLRTVTLPDGTTFGDPTGQDKALD